MRCLPIILVIWVMVAAKDHCRDSWPCVCAKKYHAFFPCEPNPKPLFVFSKPASSQANCNNFLCKTWNFVETTAVNHTAPEHDPLHKCEFVSSSYWDEDGIATTINEIEDQTWSYSGGQILSGFSAGISITFTDGCFN